MARELKRIDISDSPELLRIVEEVQVSQEPCVLQRNGKEVAMVVPTRAPRKRSPRTQPVTQDDALFRLIGIGESQIPGGVSGKKHEYLAQIYRPTNL